MGASALGARLGSFTLEMKSKNVTSATKEPLSLFSPRGLNRLRTWCLLNSGRVTKEAVSLFSPRGLNRPRTWCLTSIVGGIIRPFI